MIRTRITPVSGPVCKRVVAVLTAATAWDASLCAALESAFGAIDYRGPFVPFTGDTYYRDEMGDGLHRGWVSFREVRDPSALADWKHEARAVENRFRLPAADGAAGPRACNLDVGYLDPDKLVLASFKPGPFKLYLGRDVWADVILGYSRGVFTPTPWAFPDFRDGRYDKTLGVIREKLKADMRARASG